MFRCFSCKDPCFWCNYHQKLSFTLQGMGLSPGTLKLSTTHPLCIYPSSRFGMLLIGEFGQNWMGFTGSPVRSGRTQSPSPPARCIGFFANGGRRRPRSRRMHELARNPCRWWLPWGVDQSVFFSGTPGESTGGRFFFLNPKQEWALR